MTLNFGSDGLRPPKGSLSRGLGWLVGLVGPRVAVARLLANRGKQEAAEGWYRAVLARHPGLLSALAGLGIIMMRQRRFEEALDVWREAIDLAPETPSLLFQCARAQHRLGHFDDAIDSYLRVMRLDAAHDKALAALEELAHRFLRGGDAAREQAMTVARRLALVSATDSARSVVRAIARETSRSAAALVVEAPDRAFADFQSALELAPDLPEALRGAAACLESLGEIERALVLLDELVRVEPLATEPRLQRDRLRALVKGPEKPTVDEQREAILARAERAAMLDRARRMAREAANSLTSMQEAAARRVEIGRLMTSARAALNAGHLDEAEADYRAILERDDCQTNALASLSRLCLRQRRFAEAIEVLDRLHAIQPDVLETIEMLARAHLQEGQLEPAARFYGKLNALEPNNVDVWFTLGRIHRRLGNWASARDVWRQLLELTPDRVEVRLELALAYQHTGASDLAEALLQAVLERDPENVGALTMLGRSRGKADPAAALATWSKLAQLDPQAIEPLLQTARINMRQGRLAEAEVGFRAVLERDPSRATALSPLAMIVGERDIDEAVQLIGHWVNLDPSSAEPWRVLGRLHAQGKRLDRAEAAFARAREVEPANVTILTELARVYTDAGEHDKALEVWSKVADSVPDPTQAKLQMARIFYVRRDPRAEEILRSLLKADPDNQEALHHLAQLLGRRQATFDGALELWERLAVLDQHAIQPITQRGRLLERIGRLDEAEREYRRAVERDSRSQLALQRLSNFLHTCGRWEEALVVYQARLEIEPNRAEVIVGLGVCFDRLNRFQEARDLYDHALEREPDNATVMAYRARMLRAQGQVDAAIADFRRICELCPDSAEAWQELVFYLAGAERDDEAFAALEQAETALGATPAALVALGRAAASALFDERAVAYFQRAIAAEPLNGEIHAQFGLYYFRQGIVDGALHHLLDSRDLAPADVNVARALFDTTNILLELGHDPVILRRSPRTTGEILAPERLFSRVRAVAEAAKPSYEPVPRRIVAISSTLAPGGAERQLVTMLRGLSHRRFDLDLSLFCTSLAPRYRRDFFLPDLDGTGIDIVVLDSDSAVDYLAEPEVAPFAPVIRHFPPDMVAPIAYWLREFRRRRPQVVHAWQDSTNLMAVVAALLAGVPRIVLCCRSVRPDNPRRRLRRFMRDAYRAVLDHRAVILSNNSRAGADDYAAWLGLDPSRIEVVYNGIDFDRLERNAKPDEAAQARRDLGIPDGAPVLGGVYRMSEEKRPLLWLDVAALVAQARPDAHFVVCGDGPMRDEMRKYADDLGIGAQVHLPGAQSNIGSWFKMMDVVLLASRHEGLPNVLLEAQSLGVPVVAPDVGGMAEVVDQGVTGWTIKHADAGMLAERILFCLNDTTWREAAVERAPRFVRERFGIDAMLLRNLEVYDIPSEPGAGNG